MLTSTWHIKEENFLTHNFRSLKCVWFVEKNFFVAYNGEGGGGILDYALFLGPRSV